MFEKAETVPVQDEAPKVIAEAQKIVAAKEEAEEKVVSIKEASQAAVVAPAKVDTVKIVKGEKVKVPNKDWSINEKTEAAAKLQQAPASVPVPTTAEKTFPQKPLRPDLASSADEFAKQKSNRKRLEHIG